MSGAHFGPPGGPTRKIEQLRLSNWRHRGSGVLEGQWHLENQTHSRWHILAVSPPSTCKDQQLGLGCCQNASRDQPAERHGDPQGTRTRYTTQDPARRRHCLVRPSDWEWRLG